MAFAHINEDNISSLLRSKDSKSTQRSVARSIKLFKDYLLQKDESVYFFQWFRFTVKNSLLLNFYCFSLFAFILFSLMFITCIMIRLFNSTKKITKTPKQSHKKYSNNKQNKHRNHNAFSIIKNILPMDAGVMVDFHTQKKIKFFHRVIIYHNTLIQGQYIYNI
jgi:hypothetical protein